MPALPLLTRKQPIGEAELTGRCSASHANASRVGGEGPSVTVIDRRQGRSVSADATETQGGTCTDGGAGGPADKWTEQRHDHGVTSLKSALVLGFPGKFTYIHTYVQIYTCIHTYIYPYIRTYIYVNKNIYIYTHIYLYTHTEKPLA